MPNDPTIESKDKLLSALWEFGPNDPIEHLVLLAIGRSTTTTDAGACVTLEEIAERSRITQLRARNVISRLHQVDWIERSDPTSVDDLDDFCVSINLVKLRREGEPHF